MFPDDSNLKTGKRWDQQREKKSSRKRKDVLVSTLDDLEGSGTYLLKTFKSATQIYNNIVAFDKLEDEYLKDYSIIIFIDDIIGTGNQINENFKLNQNYVAEFLTDIFDYMKNSSFRI